MGCRRRSFNARAASSFAGWSLTSRFGLRPTLHSVACAPGLEPEIGQRLDREAPRFDHLDRNNLPLYDFYEKRLKIVEMEQAGTDYVVA